MSFLKAKYLCGAAFVALGACGGGGGGGGLSGSAGAVAALDYDPVYATTSNPTVGQAVTTTGATGLVVVYDVLGDRVVFQNVKVRTNAAGTIGYLTINEGSQLVLPEFSGGSYGDPERNFSFGLTNTNEVRSIFTTILPGDDYGLGQGHVGVETPISGLPGGSTTYEGDFRANLFQTGLLTMGVDGFLGEITITANFGNGDLAGTLVEGFDIIGTISGSTQGNGILGTVTLTDASEYSGDFSIVGKSYGMNGGTIAGVMGGSEVVRDGTSDKYHLFGSFEAFD